MASSKQIQQALKIMEDAGLKLGVNWRRELSELINDIAVRDNLTCEQVIKAAQIQTILNDDNLSTPHKRARIKKELQRRRYPLYFLSVQEFDKQLKALNLNPKIKVKPTPFFENRKLNIEYQCEDEQELKQIEADVEKLKQANLVQKAIEYVEANI